MKVRNGFVSNSSSSSFTILCEEVGVEQEPDFALNNWISPCSEGEDFIELDKEMIEYLKKCSIKQLRSFRFYKEFQRFESGAVIHKSDLPDAFTIVSDTFDYHSTNNLQDLISRYRLGDDYD
jgi:hypothetical protein